MRKLLLAFAILFCINFVNAQISGCPGVNLNLQGFSPTAAPYDPLINYGCINAAGKNCWYGYFTVCQTGTLTLSASLFSLDSIGMVVWGPFTDTVGICQYLSLGSIEGCDPLDTLTTSLSLNSLLGGHIYMVAIVSDSSNFIFQSSGTAVITGNCTPPPGPGPGCAVCAVDLNVVNFSGLGSVEDTTIDYGCVTATGQYMWYGYFTVCQGGTLSLSASMSTSAIDADITVWGPFSNTTSLCTQLTAPNIIGCGASPGADVVNLGNVTYGQVYMVSVACDTSLQVPYFTHSGTAIITGTCVPPPPCAPVNGYEMICVATVDSATQKYKIIWNEIAGNPVTHFGIMRNDFMNVPQLIDTVQITSLSEYIDNGSNPMVHHETYSLRVYDTCGTSWYTGYSVRPVFCQSSLSTQSTVNVSWSDYLDASANGPVYYVVYRGATPANMVALDTVSNTTTSWTDINPLSGISYYKIGVALYSACVPMRLQYNTQTNYYVQSFSNASPVTVVGINENSLQEVSLFPNPSEGIFTVKNVQGESTMRVFDVSGRLVAHQQLPAGTSQISLVNLEAGVYSLMIENETGFFREEVVIQR